ncbi:DUF3892 domain-containing protein [Polyangium sp. 15x6]|uniref:DUF3892 domain-containing protein n=1 Tax=Polyangium sp. 15x6 TaxID=3042687 RepID=UPI00249BBD5D|nr:DUF3892 domain-containing protein [Polyangium sp. 15x6]MDI3292010.1 hypothetical protein [Polyangium sp. 15x6]
MPTTPVTIPVVCVQRDSAGAIAHVGLLLTSPEDRGVTEFEEAKRVKGRYSTYPLVFMPNEDAAKLIDDGEAKLVVYDKHGTDPAEVGTVERNDGARITRTLKDDNKLNNLSALPTLPPVHKSVPIATKVAMRYIAARRLMSD